MGKILTLIKGAWSIGTAAPSLFSGGYGILIRLAIVALLAGAAAYGMHRLDATYYGAQLDDARVRQANAEGNAQVLGHAVSQQNAATDALKAAAAKKQAAALAAKRAAEKRAARAESEAARLRALEHAGATGPCPAGQALHQIREGLK